jgi:hypothetical protein
VEAQFEAIQSTETPLEFLLTKISDISRVHLCFIAVFAVEAAWALFMAVYRSPD